MSDNSDWSAGSSNMQGAAKIGSDAPFANGLTYLIETFLTAGMSNMEGPGPENGLGRIEPPKPTSQSSGRTQPTTLKEQLAMQQAKADPNAGTPLTNIKMGDPRRPASDGWIKMRQNINGVEVHYLKNTQTGQFADFKFK